MKNEGNQRVKAIPSRLRGWLARFWILTGIRKGPDLTMGASEHLSDALVWAARFKRRADSLLKESDLTETGERYVLAIRDYTDSLICAAGTVDAASREAWPADVQKALRSTPVELGDMGREAQKALATSMQQTCESVVGSQLAQADLAVRQAMARPLRLTLTILMASGLAGLAAYVYVARGDLARQRPWRTSSQLAVCHSIREGGCPKRPGIFFHTGEDASPWIEYDLAKPTQFSSVLVENSRDGFRERAVPLIVEIGDDQKTWREIARTAKAFDEWKTSFPTVKARFVRFRVPRKSYLHLARIEIRK